MAPHTPRQRATVRPAWALCRLLGGILVAASLLVGPCAWAQGSWPSKPVRIIVPAGPSGSSDPLARMLAEELGKVFSTPFVVENKPGANGNVGASLVARADPDGHTLLFSWTGTLVSAVTLYKSVPFNPQKDFEPIVLVGAVPNVVITNTALPIHSFAEFVAYLRAHPGEVNFGSTGSGSSWHLAGELIKKSLAVDMVHVPYTTPGGVTTDLLSNNIQATFPGSAAIAPFVKDGRVRALAVMASQRTPALPDVPSTAELGFPQLESATWMALLAPRGTSPEITKKINQAVNKLLDAPAFRTRLIGMAYIPLGGTSAQFARYMDDEIRKWGEVVKFSGAKID